MTSDPIDEFLIAKSNQPYEESKPLPRKTFWQKLWEIPCIDGILLVFIVLIWIKLWIR